ncbi:PKD domain-containing protein [Halosimplex pelagicum]|uniref:PKD domain-containing protein n=1 Tax=Halosimplex pelagicum TaxID=869886 RepID=A0A7D5TCY8_9EURY|nr:PKD domain-containing protein [Halosimplex pelagicum]QLH83349.1 PKD domain-containing protein [Halosimplex pelagicum]
MTDSIGGRGLNARSGRLVGGFNVAPTASFAAPSRILSGIESPQFDASGSSDPDNDPLSYAWDFTSDGNIDANGQTTTHTFDSTGSYDTTLTASDGSVSDTETQSVTVQTPIVDDFERGNVDPWEAGPKDETDGTNATAGVDTNRVFEGTYSFKFKCADSDSHNVVHQLTTDALTTRPVKGDRFRFTTKTVGDPKDYTAQLGRVDSNNQIRINLSFQDSAFAIQKQVDGTFTTIDSVSLSLPLDAWLTTEADWGEDDTLTATLTDETDGSELASVTGSVPDLSGEFGIIGTSVGSEGSGDTGHWTDRIEIIG